MNSGQQELQARLAELERSVLELQEALEELQEQHQARSRKLDSRLTQVQFRASHAFKDAQSILRSRIWRTLVWGGGVADRTAAWMGRVRASVQSSGNGTRLPIRIHLEQPVGNGPLAGTVPMTGWAIASGPVDRVEFEVPGLLPPQPLRSGLFRPDVARVFTDYPNAVNAGFSGTIDCLMLPEGEHELVLRAVYGPETAELRSRLTIDHSAGPGDEYHRWIAENEQSNRALIRARIRQMTHQPVISIVVPVYNTDPAILLAAIKSVTSQSYEKWQLCLADDCSAKDWIPAILDDAARDPRVQVTRLPRNGGISVASNAALREATGEYIALMDHDDMLARDALFHVVEAINRHPDVDIFYSDEDYVDREGTRIKPFFKPDWSPDLILAENYVCHLLVFRRKIALAAGGFRSEVDLSQDHDILLRMSRLTDRIHHIPKVLYHWRTEVDVTDIQRASFREQDAFRSSRKVVEDHLRESGIPAKVTEGRQPGRWRVRYQLPEPPPEVSVIIPSGGKVDVLKRNLEAFSRTSKYPNAQVVVVDNSKAGAVESFCFERSVVGRPVRYIDHRHKPFNFSAICNRAARECTSPILLFLNDDTAAIDNDWLEAMVEHAIRPEVGAVGARLLYPDGRIQHAGVTMGIFGICGHSFKGLFGEDRTFFDFPDIVRNVSAVTGACLMCRRDVFWEAGGFDEIDFPVAYNDIDLCLKIGARGYRVIYTPHANLYHYEALSKTIRDLDPRPEESAALRRKWKAVIEADPFYNPNLTTTSEDFSLGLSRPD